MKEKETVYLVNGVRYRTTEHQMLPEDILRIAGYNQEDYVLVRAKNPDKPLPLGKPEHIENGESFLALKKTNPVSAISGMADIERFVVEKLDLKVEYVKGANGDNLVIHEVTVPGGALEGKKCDVALLCTSSVPFNPHPSFHTRPALVPASTNGTSAGQISPEWQYWSRKWLTAPLSPEHVWAWILTALTQAN